MFPLNMDRQAVKSARDPERFQGGQVRRPQQALDRHTRQG
jgi:hypothetical protein